MKNKYCIIFIVLWFFGIKVFSQEWSLKLRSTVELRTFKLTNKVDVSESKLAGATIALFKGSTLINQVQSDGGGDFVIDVPANGDFILTVSYSGCNTKKFAVSTMGVPETITKDNYKPSFGIEGVIMAKAYPTVDYSILNQPLVRIVYTSNGKRFDDEEPHTNQMLAGLSRMRDTENALMNNFTTTNNIGDVALAKGDCPLAKASYEKAMTIIPGERYPSEQLPKVGDCLKQKELADKKATEDAKLATEKAEADRLAKEKAEAEKLESDKLAKDKTTQESLAKAAKADADKVAQDKLAAEKVETDRLAKEKVAAEKLEADKLAKDKTTQESLAKAAKAEADKVAQDKLATEKAEKDRLAKEKVAAEKLESDKLAKDKTTQEASVKANKAEAEKAQKDKLASEKAEKDKIAKSKEAAEKPVKEKPTTPVKETSNTLTPSGSGSDPGSSGVNTGDAKYSIPQELGADKYKATIKRADELFKMKRYAEAKPMYEEALKQKPNDVYATNKLAEIEKLTVKK